MLLGLAAIWGSSFMFIKVAVREVTPGEVVFGRVLVGTLALLPAVPFLGGWGPTWAGLRRWAGPLLLLGIFNAALPFWLLAWSEKRLDSGLAAVLQPSMPLFTVLFAYWFTRAQRVTGAKLVGVVVGFLGVLLLVGAQPSGNVLSALAVLLTAVLYAGSSVYAGAVLRETPALVTSLGALGFATLATLPLGLTELPGDTPSWKAIGSIVALGAVGLSIAYLLYFSLIAAAGAPYAALVTYLVPALALVYGAVFLGEPVTATAVGGLLLILGGVALGTGTIGSRRMSWLLDDHVGRFNAGVRTGDSSHAIAEERPSPSPASTTVSASPRSAWSARRASRSASCRSARRCAWPRTPSSTSSRSRPWPGRPSSSSWTTGSSSTSPPRRPARPGGTRRSPSSRRCGCA